MKYRVTFVISPPGVFGAPEEGKQVFPSQESKEYLGDTIHVRSLSRVGYGTLSRFRNESESIDQSLALGEIEGKIKDNFVFLEVEGGSTSEALQLATDTIELFLKHLAISTNNVYTAKALYVESDDGNTCHMPKSIDSMSVRFYNLSQLSLGIQEAEQFYSLKDPRLDKSLIYYEHAILIFDKRGIIADPQSRHYQHLLASVFLNLWKAVTAIIGDPSRRSDGYQKRYRTCLQFK